MNKEEIIRLSCEAGWPDPEGEDLEIFVKFAELVAQHEREACAKICDDRATEASIACLRDAYYEADECADAIRSRK